MSTAKKAEEVHEPTARYPEELAVGKSLQESVRIKILDIKVTDEVNGIQAIEGERLMVIRLSAENVDKKPHKIPVAGFTFAGKDFDVPSAAIMDQDKQPQNVRFAGGEMQPGQKMVGDLVTRIPTKRMSQPFLMGVWVDEKKEAFIEICGATDLPKCPDKAVPSKQPKLFEQ